MRPTTIALNGGLLLSALLSLTGCVSAPPAPTVRIVEVPVETLTKVPAARTEPIVVEGYADGPITNGDIDERMQRLEEAVERANADREWIRNREGGGGE